MRWRERCLPAGRRLALPGLPGAEPLLGVGVKDGRGARGRRRRSRDLALSPAPAPGVRHRGPGLCALRGPAADPRRGNGAAHRARALGGARPGRRAPQAPVVPPDSRAIAPPPVPVCSPARGVGFRLTPSHSRSRRPRAMVPAAVEGRMEGGAGVEKPKGAVRNVLRTSHVHQAGVTLPPDGRCGVPGFHEAQEALG